MDALASTPLHIAVVTETYPPEVNGVARTIGAMVESLYARGHHVQLVRPRQYHGDPGDRSIETLLKASMPLPKYPDLRMGLPCTASLTNAWRVRRPDIVQIVTEGPLGASALKAARKLSIPTVSEFRTHFDSYSQHYGLGLFKPLVAAYLRRFHNRSDRTLVPTLQLQQQLSDMGYCRLSVVGRGIDLNSFNPSHRDPQLRMRWNASEDHIVVLYVGRLAPEKNFGLFVQAAHAMQTTAPHVRIVVVGDGPEHASLKAANPDFIFAGQRTGADLAAHYASADVFLFPSQTETFGNVTTEAMASGLAIVAFNYAAAGQHIQHNENGLLAPCRDPARFIELARLIATDCALRERTRQAAALSALNLGWLRIVDELEKVFYELSGKSHGFIAQTSEGLACDV